MHLRRISAALPRGFAALLLLAALGVGAPSDPASPAPSAPANADSPGGKIYTQLCATCHLPDGKGTPGMHPALIGSKVVAGDPALFIALLLKGPAAVLPDDREAYSTIMPPLEGVYPDADLASVITYVRKHFAPPGTSEVTAAQIAAERKR